MTSRIDEFQITRMAFDDDVRQVLQVTSGTPLQVKEISEQGGINLERAYRLVRQMCAGGLLRKSIPPSGIAVYQSNIRTINLCIERDRLGIIVEFLDGEKWHTEFGNAGAQHPIEASTKV